VNGTFIDEMVILCSEKDTLWFCIIKLKWAEG